MLQEFVDPSTFASCDTFLKAGKNLVELGHYPATHMPKDAPWPSAMPWDDVVIQVDKWKERAEEMALTV